MAAKITAITERIAHPWRLSPSSLPKVRGSANGISSSRAISRKFVNGFGFSKGWAELAL
jgi:hypothetical protein